MKLPAQHFIVMLVPEALGVLAVHVDGGEAEMKRLGRRLDDRGRKAGAGLFYSAGQGANLGVFATGHAARAASPSSSSPRWKTSRS
jgi:hypothetical protein